MTGITWKIWNITKIGNKWSAGYCDHKTGVFSWDKYGQHYSNLFSLIKVALALDSNAGRHAEMNEKEKGNSSYVNVIYSMRSLIIVL